MAEQQNQNKNANAKEQDIHQLLKVRREKLAELQAEGKDPFQITKYDQDTHSADIKDNYAEYDGKKVSIAGRIMSKRVKVKLLSATSRTSRATSSAMYPVMSSVTIPTKTSRRWISAISSASKALYSQQRWARSLFMPIP